MRVLCIGGGPAGLYFGLLMKLQNPSHEVIVVERNRPYDTFGWGVVFSDATLENLKQADPVSAAEINAAFNHWDDIDIHIVGAPSAPAGTASSASAASACSISCRRAARRSA
jgi:anthraniloyl-CoA monooxygenase